MSYRNYDAGFTPEIYANDPQGLRAYRRLRELDRLTEAQRRAKDMDFSEARQSNAPNRVLAGLVITDREIVNRWRRLFPPGLPLLAVTSFQPGETLSASPSGETECRWISYADTSTRKGLGVESSGPGFVLQIEQDADPIVVAVRAYTAIALAYLGKVGPGATGTVSARDRQQAADWAQRYLLTAGVSVVGAGQVRSRKG